MSLTVYYRVKVDRRVTTRLEDWTSGFTHSSNRTAKKSPFSAFLLRSETDDDGLKNENFARNIVAANKIVNVSPFILNIDKRLAICR